MNVSERMIFNIEMRNRDVFNKIDLVFLDRLLLSALLSLYILASTAFIYVSPWMCRVYIYLSDGSVLLGLWCARAFDWLLSLRAREILVGISSSDARHRGEHPQCQRMTMTETVRLKKKESFSSSIQVCIIWKGSEMDGKWRENIIHPHYSLTPQWKRWIPFRCI